MTDRDTMAAIHAEQSANADTAADADRDPTDVTGLLDETLGPLTGESDNASVRKALDTFGKRCAHLDPLDRQLARRGAIVGLKGLKVDGAAALIDAPLALHGANGAAPDLAGAGLALESPEPWPHAVDGGDVFTAVDNTIRRYIVLGDAEATAAALWAFFAHAHDVFQLSPLLAITSPRPECGKSNLLAILAALVPRALPTANISAAALFRAVDAYNPTLCVDEADTAGLHDRDEPRHPEQRAPARARHDGPVRRGRPRRADV